MTDLAQERPAVAPKRMKIFFMRGIQLRVASLVAGSLTILLLFTGFHAVFTATNALPEAVLQAYKPILLSSTWRLFAVGAVYIAVVTVAAMFLSHRAVGPVARLERDVLSRLESGDAAAPFRVREGDELEGLVSAINKLMERVKRL